MEDKKLKIVLDFDGTCVTHDFPETGRDIGAVPVLKELVAHGHQLILFTMRSDGKRPKKDEFGNPILVEEKHLTNALQWFKENDIPLFGIQTNPEQHTWTSSPKAYGQAIVDDAAVGCPLIYGHHPRPYVCWQTIREHFVKMGALP